ncbi:ABC-F family ATP-binding cassette domain-containing protein [Arsenicitalea aurantiaca]|uniref:ABC-F family ATP-binding cassette domain-containing protein n=1 Tax=Arsenicitalea aurantiaca TaxID=1783274 RepID=A0A433XGE3_9HYPH|nr:ABC-F family ATP-binding cassette domain-containing protein [Arsenicitalea aurantiaca]RUT33130.1 ABC-F family ATP-binding cassette domain-containing protein [Arsenicitalea aurantiaca]
MPSIILDQISFSTPEGEPLFSELTLAFPPGRTGIVGRNGVGKSSLLSLLTGARIPDAGSVSVAGRVGHLAQAVQPRQGETIAEALGVAPDLARLSRLLDGTGTPEDAAEADWTLEARIEACFTRLDLPQLDPDRPVASLSGGQQTRMAMARLLLEEPDIIILDEPTNNLDACGREAVTGLLGDWRGMALVVSHDRALLRQMDTILELSSLGARLYGGNWDHFAERKDAERAAAEQTLAHAERRVAMVDRQVQAVRERQARRDAGGRRKRGKGDMPKILLDARQNSAERTAGSQSRIATRLRGEAEAAAEAARDALEAVAEVNLRLGSSELSPGRTVLAFDDVTGGPDIADPIIGELTFSITGPERVAVVGPNGTGKTTLLRLATGSLAPIAGHVRITPRHAMLDQQMDRLDPSLSIRENFLRANPKDGENACRAALARFLFRADAALQKVGTLSGGEMLRAGLAITLGGGAPPELLLLDEPTNHLDLDAIAAIENGLRAYDGAVLVISHDEDFLGNIGVTRRISLPQRPGQ